MKYEIGDMFLIEENGIIYEGMIISVDGSIAEISWKYHDKTGKMKYHAKMVTEQQIDDNYLKGKIDE